MDKREKFLGLWNQLTAEEKTAFFRKLMGEAVRLKESGSLGKDLKNTVDSHSED